MKYNIMDSNAPPQTRGAPAQCLNAGCGGRYRNSVVSTKEKKSVITAFRSNRFTALPSGRLIPSAEGFGRTEYRNAIRIAGGATAVSAKEPVTGLFFRSTGRDGPPGSEMIFGVPAWLIRGMPLDGGRADPESYQVENQSSGKPPDTRERGHST